MKRGGGEQSSGGEQLREETTVKMNTESAQGIKMSKEAKCEALEKQHVHDVYASTAHHFAGIRYKAWPRVKKFILELEPGSVVADVGKTFSSCGSII